MKIDPRNAWFAPTSFSLLLVALVLAAGTPAAADDLQDLAGMMAGSFSSQAQAEADSNYFDIRLQMKPIWQERSDGFWLYVEQAAASSLSEPYRQRVYRVTQEGENLFRSAVYTLPDPAAAIGAWEQNNPLDMWQPADLSEREGCAVYLERQADGSFTGGTRDRDCANSWGEATYATSEITITAEQVLSWDRGFNDQGEQVWGAELGGYVFDKLQADHWGPGMPDVDGFSSD